MLRPKSNLNSLFLFFVSVLFFGAVEQIKAQTTSDLDPFSNFYLMDCKPDSIAPTNKKHLKSFNVHDRIILESKISPDGKWLATASHDNKAKIINLLTGKENVVEHYWMVDEVIFSFDSKWLATKSNVKAKVVNLTTGEEKVIQDIGQEISTVFFSQDSNWVAAKGDKSSKIINLTTGEEKVVQHTDKSIIPIFSPDSKWFSYKDKENVNIIELSTGKEINIPNSRYGKPRFSPDSMWFATLISGAMKVINLQTSEETHIEQTNIGRPIFSPDSKFIFIFHDNIINLATKEQKIIAHDGYVQSVKFTHDSKLCAAVMCEHDPQDKVKYSVNFINVLTGEETVVYHGDEIYNTFFSPDGLWCVAATLGTKTKKTATIINLGTGKIIRVNNNRSWFNDSNDGYVYFSPDSKYCVTAISDGSANLINLSTGEQKIIRHNQTVTPDRSFKITFVSPDSKWIVSRPTPYNLKIMNFTSGDEKVIEHEWGCYASGFSHLGKYLYTISGGDLHFYLVENDANEDALVKYLREYESLINTANENQELALTEQYIVVKLIFEKLKSSQQMTREQALKIMDSNISQPEVRGLVQNIIDLVFPL